MTRTRNEPSLMQGIPPQQLLWQAVVLRALYDATNDHPTGYKRKHAPGSSREETRYRLQAIAWITEGGDDFRAVCTLAGLDPDFIQDAFMAGKIDGRRLRDSTGARDEA